MRLLFGVLSLLVVVAIVGVLAKRQLQAVQVPVVADAPASTAPLSGTPAEQSRQLQRKMADDAVKAMQQGMQRNDAAGSQ